MVSDFDLKIFPFSFKLLILSGSSLIEPIRRLLMRMSISVR